MAMKNWLQYGWFLFLWYQKSICMVGILRKSIAKTILHTFSWFKSSVNIHIMHYVYQEPIWSLLWLLNHVQHTKFKSSNTSRTVLKLSFTVKSSRPSEWILYMDMLDQEILNPPSSSDQTPLDQTVLYSDSLVLYLIFNMASLFKSLGNSGEIFFQLLCWEARRFLLRTNLRCWEHNRRIAEHS